MKIYLFLMTDSLSSVEKIILGAVLTLAFSAAYYFVKYERANR